MLDTTQIKVSVLVFGQLTDVIESGSIWVEAEDTDQLTTRLHEQFPELKNKQFAIAVNQQIIAGNTALTSQSVVALLPPFSGG